MTWLLLWPLASLLILAFVADGTAGDKTESDS